MTATTPKGFPYPLGTDRVMDGDDAIKALATAVDTKLGLAASGTATVNTVGGQTVSVPITFPAGLFTAPPNVTATIGFSGFGTMTVVMAPAVTAITATGFTLSLARTGTGSGGVPVCWIAHQPT